ncbi:MAG TPA: methanol/ethanol family PQQ-dependent dehydrogenase [Dokdonella sp.]
MLKKLPWAPLGTVLATLLAPLSASADMANYSPVTEARLISPEPQNWLMYRGNYAGWGYSALDRINVDNVAKLTPAWEFSTGMSEGHQAPPLVNNGVMFITTPNNQAIALDAKSGKEIWRYKKQIPDELQQLHPTNRGLALFNDNAYLATTDAFLVALDAKTGKEKWKTAVADWKSGYYMTLQPLVANGKIIVGCSGGEYGIRGFIAAFDSETGKEIWRTYTVAGPGDPNAGSWPTGKYATGGGSVWITGSYDPKEKLTYWGIGNAGPWMGDTRPGDNLYANSVLALDVDTGKMKGYHQYHHNDSWDWDEVSAPLLIDIEHNGKMVPSLVHAGRNGYLWWLDRDQKGKNDIGFVDAWPYVEQNVFTKIDPKTGRPTYDPTKVPGTNKTTTYCPSLWGGKDWPPEAYNPKTGLFYIPAQNNLCAELTGEPVKYKAGDLYIGVPLQGILTNVRMTEKAKDHIGEVQAWDLSKKKLVWQHNYQYMNWGPLMTTAGNLVFGGGTNDRKFHAFDATTGKLLWEFPTNSGVIGVPSTFEIDGEQYVAVQSGWGVDAERMQGAFNAVLPPEQKNTVPQGGVVWVFKLPK